MTDIRKEIKELLSSVNVDTIRLSEIVNTLREEGKYDIIGWFTKELLKHHANDYSLMLRAWYLTEIEQNYKEASDILRTIGKSNNVMFTILNATVTLNTTFDADAADSILEEYANANGRMESDAALEAARMFITSQFTDMAEKWIMRYEGDKDNDYLIVYAEILIAKEDYKAAADIYQNITSENPKDSNAWTRFSDILISLKDYKNASNAAQHALDINKDSRKAAENLNICQLCLSRHNKKTNKTNNF